MNSGFNRLPKGRSTFAIIVEGECEFWYFQMLKRNEPCLRVNLLPEIPKKKKLKEQYQYVVAQSRIYDMVFWIVDFDVIIAETRDAKKGGITRLEEFKGYIVKLEKSYKNVNIIINSPCIEFWLLLHFSSKGAYFENCDKVCKQLKNYLNDYEKTKKYYTKQDNDIYLKLKCKLKDAISSSAKQPVFDFLEFEKATSQMSKFFCLEIIKQNLLQR